MLNVICQESSAYWLMLLFCIMIVELFIWFMLLLLSNYFYYLNDFELMVRVQHIVIIGLVNLLLLLLFIEDCLVFILSIYLIKEIIVYYGNVGKTGPGQVTFKLIVTDVVVEQTKCSKISNNNHETTTYNNNNLKKVREDKIRQTIYSNEIMFLLYSLKML